MSICEKNNWIEYWNRDDFWENLNLWDLNAKVFLKRAKNRVSFGKQDAVLNIGSGPGILDLELARKVHSVLAVDTASRFVEMAKEHCRNAPNVTVALLGDDYTDVTVFNRQFSLVLCISVVQYYKSVEELEKLICSAQKVTSPGGKMLIADLNLKRKSLGFLWDAFCSVLQGIRYGYAVTLFKMASKRWFGSSAYRDADASNTLLQFSFEEIEDLIDRMGLKAEVIRKSFSIYANRPSLLIHF